MISLEGKPYIYIMHFDRYEIIHSSETLLSREDLEEIRREIGAKWVEVWGKKNTELMYDGKRCVGLFYRLLFHILFLLYDVRGRGKCTLKNLQRKT